MKPYAFFLISSLPNLYWLKFPVKLNPDAIGTVRDVPNPVELGKVYERGAKAVDELDIGFGKKVFPTWVARKVVFCHLSP